MPGRQAHGRPVTSKPSVKSARPSKKSKAKLQATALDAYAIAAEQFPSSEKRTPRFRQLEAAEDVPRKHGRQDEADEDDGEGEGEDEERQRKRPRPSRRSVPEDGDDDAEYGSDSEGNEWRLNGNIPEDEDSEIDSDEAFGESDEDKFEGYSFGGSKSKPREVAENDTASDMDSLGDDAIDLAQALDQSDDESIGDEDESGSGSDGDSSPPSSDDEDEDEDGVDPESLGALQTLVAKYAEDPNKADHTSKQKQKVNLEDLGLSGVQDPQIRKSLKIMAKEERETHPGSQKKKLDVPLARRQQDKVLRAAAYEKTNETLDRWTETVKLNRRAEHLVFPLPQNLPGAGLDNSEIRPLTEKNATNELESTILSIMEQSGLVKKPSGAGSQEDDDDGTAGLSKLELKALWNSRRRVRELNSRETQRAKRIKKIKSKAYHRIHRKARQKVEMRERAEMELNGEIDSEEERDAQDRKRALERVGARHRDSKWARSGAKTKRAVWDDDFRAGVHEMLQKDEDLRRRKEGRTAESNSEDEEDDGNDDDLSSGSEDSTERGRRHLRKRLDEVAHAEDGEPESKLMQMKFMRRAEEALKRSNDELIEEMRRDLASDREENEEELEEEGDVGRRSYGLAKAEAKATAIFGGHGNLHASRAGTTSVVTDEAEQSVLSPARAVPNGTRATRNPNPELNLSSISGAEPAPDSTTSVLSKGAAARRRRAQTSSNPVTFHGETAAPDQPRKRKVKTSPSALVLDDGDVSSHDDDEDGAHRPRETHSGQAAVAGLNFGSLDAAGEFAREKAQAEEDDDEKVVDNTLPGWGSWVGKGLSEREKAKNKGRWLTKVPGVKKKDRKDARLDKVIISEKTVKKNSKYLASQLPRPFESREQYERSLRLPIGQEWNTKVTFNETTKPRIIVKQGIITPISKPVL